MIDTDCIHPPRGADHSESINADYININIIYNIYISI